MSVSRRAAYLDGYIGRYVVGCSRYSVAAVAVEVPGENFSHVSSGWLSQLPYLVLFLPGCRHHSAEEPAAGGAGCIRRAPVEDHPAGEGSRCYNFAGGYSTIGLSVGRSPHAGR
jgi:hypothetical protein